MLSFHHGIPQKFKVLSHKLVYCPDRDVGQVCRRQPGAVETAVDDFCRKRQRLALATASAGDPDGVARHQRREILAQSRKFEHVRDEAAAVVGEDVVVLRDEGVLVRPRGALLEPPVHGVGVVGREFERLAQRYPLAALIVLADGPLVGIAGHDEGGHALEGIGHEKFRGNVEAIPSDVPRRPSSGARAGGREVARPVQGRVGVAMLLPQGVLAPENPSSIFGGGFDGRSAGFADVDEFQNGGLVAAFLGAGSAAYHDPTACVGWRDVL